MKKSLAGAITILSFSAIAGAPQFNNLSKNDVKNVSKEFGANFSHTSVAAPETDGLWGVEVGLVGGKTSAPEFSDVINDSGGNGSDFKNLYHANVMARAHFPFDLFAEVTYLPEQELSGVKLKSQSIGVGWNLGGFLSLPIDVAAGLDYGSGDLSFHQDIDLSTSTPAADIKLATKTTNTWVGVSKSFLFFTPYAKVGMSKIKSDLEATGSILVYQNSQKETVNVSGNYFAVGANFQLLFIKLGLEASQIQSVKRISGKLSVDF